MNDNQPRPKPTDWREETRAWNRLSMLILAGILLVLGFLCELYGLGAGLLGLLACAGMMFLESSTRLYFRARDAQKAKLAAEATKAIVRQLPVIRKKGA